MFAPLPGAVFLQETLQTTLSENATVILLTIYVLMLAIFLGFELIGRVPATLHTPLMSGTNAIHGIVVLGGIVLLAEGHAPGALNKLLLTIAVAFGTINVVGGFLVTDRMLEMFKSKPKEQIEAGAEGDE